VPRTHTKCEECGALLQPRGEDAKESWLHMSNCSKFENPHKASDFDAGRIYHRPLMENSPAVATAFGHIPAAAEDLILEDTKLFSSGATSSGAVPPFHLIPFEGLVCEAQRFGLGLLKHGRDNYMKAVREQDIEWMQDRINHGIVHMLKWLLEIEGYVPRSGDDHAGAVKWLGSIMKLYEKEHYPDVHAAASTTSDRT